MSLPHLRSVFMGTPDYVLPVLRATQNLTTCVGVFTQPPRPVGRGHKLQASPVQLAAEQAALPVHCPTSFKRQPEFVAALQALQPDIIIVASYGLILPKAVLQLPRFGCLCLHASYLPRWRGAAPAARAVQAGDDYSGISMMQMDAGIDTGAVWLQEKIPLTPTTTGASLLIEIFNQGAELLPQTLQLITSGAAPTPQPDYGSTYAQKLDKAEALLDFTKTATELERQIRAFTPWPGSYFMLQGHRVKVLQAAAIPNANIAPAGQFIAPATISCGAGTALVLQQVQREGKSTTDGQSFWRGIHNIKIGDQAE